MRLSALKYKSEPIAIKVRWMTTFWERLIGLIGKTEIEPDTVFYFPSCHSVHTFLMRIPIDVIYVSKDHSVVAIFHNLKPFRLLFPRRKVKHVFEAQAGWAAKHGISLGEKLEPYKENT